MESSADRPTKSDDSTDDESPLEEIAAGVTIGLILTVAFGLLALGVPWFWIAFPVGFAGVLPVVMGLVKLYERRRAREVANNGQTSETSPSDAEDALETLRERYARGEFDDEEFERRLERLLETETIEDASAFAERARESSGYDGRDRRMPESERERERETERER
ncbi:SHOCT domain-containing protein [Halobacteria archaeon AArc-m2/3/4]|uniref:SHOCT domain-containing protein n=1 Tax=Natronoglomus mannanivorans TaxID=2979990 RepID=A0ABT2Q9W1_9EURY|nr:SHOCT domain-containing protein [Halobacteria archaeon AArc-m2/3/4]